MPSRLQMMTERGLIKPPQWLPSNTMYETIMGSVAYGVSSDTSDMDVYGFAIPPKEMVFPHLAGEIEGFGRQKQRFEQYQQHHVKFPDKGEQYDFAIFNIVKYFSLAMENNPNMIDSLYTPQFCVLHATKVGQMVREKRDWFLHKGSWHKFKGYAFGQMHKMEIKERGTEDCVAFEQLHKIDRRTTFQEVLDERTSRDKAGTRTVPALAHLSDETLQEYFRIYEKGMLGEDGKGGSKRFQSVKVYGFDVKFAYHVVRLLDEVEQIMTTGTIDLQRNREQLKSIRRGEMKPEEIKRWFSEREKELEQVYNTTKVVPHSPDEGRLKQLLIDCLEEHYGSLAKFDYVNPDGATNALREIAAVVDKNRNLLGIAQ